MYTQVYIHLHLCAFTLILLCGHVLAVDVVAATNAERRKEAHYRDRTSGTKFVPFALETYGALSARSDRFLVCIFSF